MATQAPKYGEWYFIKRDEWGRTDYRGQIVAPLVPQPSADGHVYVMVDAPGHPNRYGIEALVLRWENVQGARLIDAPSERREGE